MIKTHKTECFPNEIQKHIIETNFGMRRFFFNTTIKYLENKYGDLKENRKLILKKEVMELRGSLFRRKYAEKTSLAPAAILDTTMEDVMFALKSLWRKGKKIEPRKKKFCNTCRFFKKTDTSFRYENGSKYISTVRLHDLKLAEPLRWNDADIKTLTIKKTAGRYFVSITCEIPDPVRVDSQDRHIGIDWGLSTYVVGYDGEYFVEEDFNNKTLSKLDKKIAKRQRALSKKVEKSKNFEKATAKLQQAYLDFDNYRHDFVYKLVNDLSKEYDTATIEGLGVRFVTKNKHLAHRAKQKPFYLFKKTLINKFLPLGKKVYLAPKTYPSTQTCSRCGNVKPKEEKLVLGDKTYICKKCGLKMHRDENASINLYRLRNLQEAKAV
jgi:putative transposase